MKISDIYKHFIIPPNLQVHMLRVASLAEMIADSWQGQMISKRTIVEASLIHDLGNILKFDFENFPQLLGKEEKNIDYWKQVQIKIRSIYGSDEDSATIQMTEELSVNKDVMFIVSNWGFKNFSKIDQSNNIEWKICVYADHRISPNGIVSLIENVKNKQARYKFNKKNASHLSSEADNLLQSAVNIEKYISENCKIDLQSISNEEIDKVIEKLSSYEIITNIQ